MILFLALLTTEADLDRLDSYQKLNWTLIHKISSSLTVEKCANFKTFCSWSSLNSVPNNAINRQMDGQLKTKLALSATKSSRGKVSKKSDNQMQLYFYSDFMLLFLLCFML